MNWTENRQYTWSEFSSYGYDAAWSVALMLNKSVNVLKDTNFTDGEEHRLEHFTYQDSEMTQVFFRLLKETDFIGVSVSKV